MVFMEEEEERRRLHEVRLAKATKPSIKGFFLVSAFYLCIAFLIFLVIGFLTDGYGTTAQASPTLSPAYIIKYK